MMFLRAAHRRTLGGASRRGSVLLAPQRANGSKAPHSKVHADFGFLAQKPRDGDVLPFDQEPATDGFGELVRAEHYQKMGDLDDGQYARKVELRPEPVRYETSPSPYRNDDGTFVHGSTAEEARLDPRTLAARADGGVVRLPAELARVIGGTVLSAVAPDKLRERSALIYQSLEREQIQKAPESAIEADAHIAALFLQNYAHARKVLLELQKRVGAGFCPDSVLDVGYGPATGMIALNEIMGRDFRPAVKEAYIVGRSNKEMKKRALTMLCAQASEAGDAKRGARTKIRDALPSAKQYELIIVNQSLLSREYNFPKDVDVNLHMVLRLLKPGGHLVILERGNALGFEIVARARQVMLRPESYKDEGGRIPRPYIKGSSYKPQKLRREDQLITDDHVEHEKRLLARMEREDAEADGALLPSDLERDIDAQHGAVSDADLKFEFEDSGDFDLVPPAQSPAGAPPTPENDHVDYHLSVVAPCSHHGQCPLQLGDPKFYHISGHKHRLQFCSFNQIVERPKYTMELKKGKRLATQWRKGAEDGFGTDLLSKKTRKSLEGSGRPGGNNSESGNFSYLIVQRAPNDAESIRAIESARELKTDGQISLPRILEFPTKVKKNVKLKMCAPSGNIEFWQVPKSLGKQAYHDARKARQGDLWALGKKSVVVQSQLSEKKWDALNRLAKTQRKFVVKEKRKKEWKKLVSKAESDFEDPADMHDSLAADLESSKKYRTAGKRAKFDVDLDEYRGR